MKESRRISGAEPRRFVRSRPRTASAQTLIFLSPKAPRGPLSAEDGNPEAPISGQHQGHFLHCITRHHRAPTMSKGAFPKPALHRRSSQRCKMATAAQPLTLLAERAPELMHYHPPAEPTLGHLPPVPRAHQPGPPREGAGHGRGDAHGQHRCSFSSGDSSAAAVSGLTGTKWLSGEEGQDSRPT